ncbi:MAG: ribosome maturation factor RimP [Clostridiales bacterium]|nr:ribosome maturation factor RimP [Clostridiales bacterium]
MAKRTDIELRTEQLVQPIIDENHFELVDVEYVKEGANWYLRVYADKEGGINIDDCVLISRALEAKLDEDDFIQEAYILEVSSPGLGRPLKKDKDFERSIGRDVEIKLYRPIEKQKEWEGTLVSYDNDSITITLEDGANMEIKRSDIALIRLALDF